MGDTGQPATPEPTGQDWQQAQQEWLRQREEHQRRLDEALAHWIRPGPDGDPALVQLPDGRPVWQIVVEIWARDRDLGRTAADGIAESAALEAVMAHFRSQGSAMIPVLSRSVAAAALPASLQRLDFDRLPPALAAALGVCDVDVFLEKHEGPWPRYWASAEDDPDHRPQFQVIADQVVLLPIARSRQSSISLRRATLSADGATFLLELRDAWAVAYYGSETAGGQLAVCDRWPGHRFFVCHTYHEWYPVGPGTGHWG